MQMKQLLALLGIAALMAACHDDHDDSSPVEPELNDRTVIVYIAGENNLSSSAGSDLVEMTEGSKELQDRQRLVAFVDDANSRKPYIVELTAGRRDTLKTYDSDFYSSDPERFRDVIETIEGLRPAKSYDLVLWGHAKGWFVENDSVAQARPLRAYGIDSGSNLELGYTFGSRWMNITQMARALDGLPRFRSIFADCCCMMCVEVAYELRNVADWLIGSPAEIPSNGAPYQTVTPLLFSEADDFYKPIVDTYYDEYYHPYQEYSVPLSAVNLSRMDELASQTRAVLRAPSDYDTDSIAYYYCDRGDAPVMFDMCSIMERNLDADSYAQWKRTLDLAVPYRRFSQMWITDTWAFDVYKGFSTSVFTEDIYGGLSMFVPKLVYNFSSNHDFNRDIRKMSWYDAVGWGRFEPFW